MIDLALHYASKRWPVFPLGSGRKTPAIPRDRGGHGCLDATCDVEKIETWWREYPDANIGIATGHLSGLLVIDIDPRKTADWLASINALALPQTFTVRTASGGFHLYFALPKRSKITIGADLLPGIDWRGNGGYVVGVGSVVNEATYVIARNCAIAPAPAALMDRIASHGKGARVAARNVETGRMVIPDGKRNDQMFRIACGLRRFGVDLNSIIASLRSINADHCEPPMRDDDLRAIAASAMRYAPDSTTVRGQVT